MKFKITVPIRNKNNKSKTKNYFYIEYGDKTYALFRKRGTFDWIVDTGEYYKHYIIQFSFKNPWWKPRVEFINNDKFILYGWLFFYFGWSMTKQTDEGEWIPITRQIYDNRITLKEHYKLHDRKCFIISTLIETLLFIMSYFIFSNCSNCDLITAILLSMLSAAISNTYISTLIKGD